MRFITVLLLALSVSFSLQAKEIKVGDVPPSYIGRALNGKKVQLSEMAGKVVVVTFWASWCGPCLAELPVLDSVQRQVSPDRLQVVAINFSEGKRQVKYIQKQMPDSLIQFTLDKRRFASRKYNVKGIPHMVIIDHEGKVAHVHVGYGGGTADRLIDELNTLLKAAPKVISNPVVRTNS